jgi:hypothetical protein
LSQYGIDLEKAFENLAAALTKLILDYGAVEVTGQAAEPVVYVEVRWVWLMLPAALSCLGTVLLLLTARTTRLQETPLWKSSVFPLLFHGLDKYWRREQKECVREGKATGVEQGTGLYSVKVSGMLRAARETKVRLKVVGDEVERVVLGR